MQTMNYVGHLAGQMFVQVKELYRGLNPTTLSGCIDVIVVRQPDGSLQCSPFHVRFGKLGVLRSHEKVVDIEINEEPVSLHMKLGANGEAFFVQETEQNQETVPSHLATSPIQTEGAALLEVNLGKTVGQSLGTSQCNLENVAAKKRRRRRRKARGENTQWDGDAMEYEDVFTIEMSTDEEKEQSCSWMLSQNTNEERESEGSFDTYWSTLHCPMTELRDLSSPHNGVLSVSCPQQSSFCQPIQSCSRPSSPKSDSELVIRPSDAAKQDNPEMLWAWGELPQAAQVSFDKLHKVVHTASPLSAGVPVSESTHLQTITGDMQKHCNPDSCKAVMHGAEIQPHYQMELEDIQSVSKTNSPHIHKDKKSRHLGTDGIYLDDITELEPEVAALYFPKSDMNSTPRVLEKETQSVSSSGADSGAESYSEQMGDQPCVTISLCGGLTDNKDITTEQFSQKVISYQHFTENPALIDDPNLVVKIGTTCYNWSTAAPLVLAMQAFHKPLPKATVEAIMKEKMPKKGGHWWFSWRGRNSSSKLEAEPGVNERKEQIGKISLSRLNDETSSSDDEHTETLHQPYSVHLKVHPPCYKKALRLTSEQLMALHLKDGANDVVFSVTTQYQGTCRCKGTIYLWNWDDKIVISDIDGTITRSDTLGHILPTLGKDWTHQGIARLYHNVNQNGYKFLYCSARAIGMAGMTRGYLHWVNEQGTMLPRGPVLLSPSSLFSAFHREVIEKKPEKFKIECLMDIKNLFYPNTEPFYAAFGNRDTDVFSYKEVGVPLNRIFTVNPKGELIQEHAKTNISSYGHLCDLVDHIFPHTVHCESSDSPCSQETFRPFTCWTQQQQQQLVRPEIQTCS